VRPTPSQLGNRGEVLFGRVERARIEEGQPQDNLVLSGTWDRGPLTLVGRTQRFGEVTSRQPVGNESLDQTFAAKWITDLSVGYRMLRRVTLTLGADNVFDVYPDENDDPGNVTTNVAGNANFGIFPYNGISPFGFNGRFVYLRATVGL
jgi:iron complex outermembrane receptor protein